MAPKIGPTSVKERRYGADWEVQPTRERKKGIFAIIRQQLLNTVHPDGRMAVGPTTTRVEAVLGTLLRGRRIVLGFDAAGNDIEEGFWFLCRKASQFHAQNRVREAKNTLFTSPQAWLGHTTILRNYILNNYLRKTNTLANHLVRFPRRKMERAPPTSDLVFDRRGGLDL